MILNILALVVWIHNPLLIILLTVNHTLVKGIQAIIKPSVHYDIYLLHDILPF